MGRRPPGHRLTLAPGIRTHGMRHRFGTALATAILLGTVGCAQQPLASATPEPVLVPAEAAHGTVLALSGLDWATRDAWRERLDWAAETLTGAGLGPLDTAWDGRLLIELPPTQQWYARLAGADGSDAAAVTRCPADGVRITVNPVVAGKDATYLDSLVLHEGVHVATGSSCEGEAAQWVEEGLAEWVACEHDEASLAANQQWVVSYLQGHGLPAGLPADADFRGPSEQVSAAYALARQVVASAVDRLGRPAAMELLKAHYAGDADQEVTRQLTGWYLDDLGRLSGSAPR